jgi:hypothetical protein
MSFSAVIDIPVCLVFGNMIFKLFPNHPNTSLIAVSPRPLRRLYSDKKRPEYLLVPLKNFDLFFVL